MDGLSSEQHVTGKAHSSTAFIMLTVLFVVLLAAGTMSTYYWQHHKVTQLSNSLASLKSQNSKLNTSFSSIQKQYNQAKTTLDNYQARAINNPDSNTIVATQADLALTINGARYVNPAGTVTENGKWFGVNITLTNNTSSTISVSDSDFHLKDQGGNEYPEETIQGASTLPGGWISLPNQALAPGDSLKGTVTFQMASTTIKSFNFINVTKTYPVTSSN